MKGRDLEGGRGGVDDGRQGLGGPKGGGEGGGGEEGCRKTGTWKVREGRGRGDERQTLLGREGKEGGGRA